MKKSRLKKSAKDHFTLTKGRNNLSFKNSGKLLFMGKINDIKAIMTVHNEMK